VRYLATAFHRFASDRTASASADLDVDAGGAGSFVDTDSLRPAAPTGQPDTAKPVSVGIARSDDVDEYLAGHRPRPRRRARLPAVQRRLRRPSGRARADFPRRPALLGGDISVGANVPVLNEVAWTALGIGLVTALAGGLLLLGISSGRVPS
jgi:hypothetical protein